jgi:hypothetical protein
MSGKVVTISQAATMKFKPWRHKSDEWVPPSNEEWSRLADPHLIMIRMAWRLLYKTKPQLVKFLKDIDNDAGSALLQNISSTEEYLKALHAVVAAAEARLFCAGSAMKPQGVRRKRVA